MKIAPYASSLATGDAVVQPSLLNVYMHVLGPARSDVRVMREATALVQAGYNVSIVDVEKKGCGSVEEDVQNVSLHHVFVSEKFLATRFARWMIVRAVLILSRVTFRLLRAPADIYHAHDVSGLLPCYIAACVRRKPLIFDAHELPLSGMSIHSRRIVAFLSYMLVHIIARCSGVITVSPPIAQEIYRHYQRSDVSLVRNIPPYKAIAKSDRLRQHLALPEGTQIALYQGYIMSNRGLDLLVQAAKFMDARIVIVMMGSDVAGYLLQLQALATREGVGDRVKFLPSVPYTELLDWTASADIGLTIYRPDYSPNVKMCLPNKLFEYFMAGLPVLTSQLDAITDLVTTYDVGYVLTVISPEAIGKVLNTLLADRSRLKHMRQNALNASQKDLNWENEKTQLIQLYHGIEGKW
jgi:glycosyltransferase involved in cell wall biosynthesis